MSMLHRVFVIVSARSPSLHFNTLRSAYIFRGFANRHLFGNQPSAPVVATFSATPILAHAYVEEGHARAKVVIPLQ